MTGEGRASREKREGDACLRSLLRRFSLVVSNQKSKSRMKITIRKMIRSRIQRKSRTGDLKIFLLL
jgi:hypothetical protein